MSHSSRPRRTPADPVRQVAYDVLRAVAAADAYANLVLPGLLRERRLTGRDAALATELTYGTLRGRGTYDAILQQCVDRPLSDVDPDVLDMLRLGCHQLLASRIPTHAAVSTSVGLARAELGQGRAGFVNAVLRRVSARELDDWVALATEGLGAVDAAAIRYSHPRWIVSAFRDALGSLAEAEAAMEANNVAPEVALVARPGRCEVSELLTVGAEPGRWSPVAARWPKGDPGSLAAVREGRAGVQDEGSQLVALALGAAPLAGPDTRWLDLCAGPGGKAALLGGLARLRDAQLTAVELHAHRASLVRAAVAGTAEVVVGDGTDPAFATGDHDRVLVDAPCTGLGALRRRPEARWRRTPADLAQLGPLQRALLGNALAAVRLGGVVGYVTCSPHLAETQAVVTDTLRSHDAELIDARPLLPGVDQLGDGPTVQLWPHRHGTDAMFLALLRRRT